LILRIARNAVNQPFAHEVAVVVGKRYRIQGWFRGDGNAFPRLAQGSALAIVDGTTSTDWQEFDVEAVADSTSFLFFSRTSTGTEHTEWDDVTITEVNPLNGDITGATINVSAGSKLKKAYTFDGTNDFSNIFSGEINSIFDPTKGTLLAFAKVSGSGVWTDSTTRFIAKLQVDANNRVDIFKTTTNDRLQVRYEASGTEESIAIDTSAPTDYFMVAMTWDSSGNIIGYLNGVETGTPQSIAGTWVGNLLSTATTIGAANTTPGNVWDGDLAHVQLLTEVLSAADILRIAKLGGVA